MGAKIVLLLLSFTLLFAMFTILFSMALWKAFSSWHWSRDRISWLMSWLIIIYFLWTGNKSLEANIFIKWNSACFTVTRLFISTRVHGTRNLFDMILMPLLHIFWLENVIWFTIPRINIDKMKIILCWCSNIIDSQNHAFDFDRGDLQHVHACRVEWDAFCLPLLFCYMSREVNWLVLTLPARHFFDYPRMLFRAKRLKNLMFTCVT